MSNPILKDQCKSAFSWEYETKCKRCGLKEVRYSHKSQIGTYENFKFAIDEAIRVNLQFSCACCEKKTIHYILAYEVL